MTKQPLDMEKLFKQSFNDFTPKTSARFNTKMAKRIGFASLFGFTITSSLAKIGAALKAIAFETAGLMKTAGIIKSIAVVTVVSTTVATPLIINTVEKAHKKKIQQTLLMEKRKVNLSYLPVLEMKTSFINLADLETENELSHHELLHNNTLHNILVPTHIYTRDNIQLASITSKQTTVLGDIESNHINISQNQIKNNTKGSTSLLDKNEQTLNSNITNKENSISGKTVLNNKQQAKQNSTVLLGDNSNNKVARKRTLYLKSIPYFPLKPENDSENSIYKNNLKLTTDIFEEPSDKNLLSDVLIFGEVHFGASD